MKGPLGSRTTKPGDLTATVNDAVVQRKLMFLLFGISLCLTLMNEGLREKSFQTIFSGRSVKLAIGR